MSIRTERETEQKAFRSRLAYIVNVGDERWEVTRPYSTSPYIIEARGDRQFSVLEISGAHDRMDIGDGKKMNLDIMSDEIARDLIHEQNLAPFGLFVSYSPKPSKEEIAEAEKRRDEHYLKLVEDADKEWMRFHNVSMIQDSAKRAARRLGFDREWLYAVPQKQEECPACGEMLKPGVALCKSCHVIVNQEAYAKLKFAAA